MYKLHGYKTQNTMKVLYVLSELKTPFEFNQIDLRSGQNREPSFKAVNPFGKVPTLEYEGRAIFESGAICRMVANMSQSSLYPENKIERALVDQWLDFFAQHTGRQLTTIFYERILKPNFNMGESDEKACDAALKFIDKQAEVINTHLATNKYFCGSELTIADLVAFAYVEQIEPCKISIDKFAHFKAWYENIGSRPCITEGRSYFN